MNEQPEEKLARKARAVFAAAADNLDRETAERLLVARRAALAGGDAGPARTRRGWLPAGALAAGLALVGALSLLRGGPDSDVLPATTEMTAEIDDLEILVAEDDLEMLEDLAFYRWLAETGEAS